MPGKRGKNGQPAGRWESVKENDRFIRIFDGMRRSAAWQDLTASARGLYLEFKGEYKPDYHDRNLISDNHDRILFPRTTWAKIYGENGKKAWERDRKALMEHGFIEVVEDNRTRRLPNVYKLSDKWRVWEPKPPP